MSLRSSLTLCALLFALVGCGGEAEQSDSAMRASTWERAPELSAAGGAEKAHPFSCPKLSRVFRDAAPIRELDRLQDIVTRVEHTAWDGFAVRRAEATNLGVVALVTGELDEARGRLREVGVAHVYRWDPSVASVGVDGPGQVQQVLQWLLDPAGRELRAAYRGVGGFEGVAYWQAAGAVLLQWKAPIPPKVQSLAGLRSDGVRVIVEPTRYSARDFRAASAKVIGAIRAGRVDAEWSSTYGCGDGSGLVVGIEPASLGGDRRSSLQTQLTAVANMPVYVVPEEAPVPLVDRD